MSVENEKLILLVQKYKELYDMSNKSYSNLEVRDSCWGEISEIMEISVLECKEKWKKLRDCFRKAIKNRKIKSGASAKKVRPWKFEQQMAFLLPHIEEREQVSSVPSPPSPASPAQTMEELDVNLDSEEIENEAPQNSSMPDVSVSATTSQEPQPGRRKIKPKVFAADVLSKYLEAKDSRKTLKAQTRSHDPLANFFLSMADTVRSLPLDLQISVKTAVFKTVTDAELVALQRNQAKGSISSSPSNFSDLQSMYPAQLHSQELQSSYRDAHSSYHMRHPAPAQSYSQESQYPYRDAQSSNHIRHPVPGPSFQPSTQQYIYRSHQFHQPSQISENQLTELSPLPLPSPQASVVSPNPPDLYSTEHDYCNNMPESSEST